MATNFATILTSSGKYQAPLFRGGNPFDYHLSSASAGIDAGDPGFAVPPGGGARIDIGAFEFVATLGDLNGDGAFSAVDIVLLLNCVFQQTGNCDFAMTDLNCDGQLSATDVVLELGLVFLNQRTTCEP